MKGLLRKLGLLGTNAVVPELPPFDAPLAPERPFAAIGDIHGRYDLLTSLLGHLRESYPDHTVVLVGDYIDRGEESAQVLRHAMESGDVCLMGNHEEMCLRFLDDPEAHGDLWLRNGGLQTLASFGISGAGDRRKVRDALALAMGDSLIEWMRALPIRWPNGNVRVVHAGADPAEPVDAQGRETLLWGHRDFGRVPRQDGTWVVHGHTIQETASCADGRIGIDTGAYVTGNLTAAVVDEGGCRFVHARPGARIEERAA